MIPRLPPGDYPDQLQVSISMRQIDGDKNFTALVDPPECYSKAKSFRPPLKTAPVFGGIAGIMTSEQGDLDDLGQMPSMSSKTREIGELQDMYRRTLAASWACQIGELPADECIENIFAGGDGWGKHGADAKPRNSPSGKSTEDSTGDAESGGEARPTPTPMHHRRTSSGFGKRGHLRMSSKTNEPNGIGDNRHSRGNHSQHVTSSPTEAKGWSHGQMHEVDEFDVREDLKSWEISPRP